MAEPIEVGDTVIETTPSGRRIEHTVVALDQPPENPRADPGPYVALTNGRGRDLRIKAEHIHSEGWLHHIPARRKHSPREEA
jgi:hypothetical protein